MKLLSRLKTLLPMSERLRWNVMRAKATGERELGYVNALCDHSSVSVDIGANLGIYSYLMRQHSKSVIAFEPNPFYANVVRRALKDVQVIEAAVSDREGTSVLRVPLTHMSGGMGTIEQENTLDSVPVQEFKIPVVTIDSLQLANAGFIKIDVEGHELAALRGATATIEGSRPNFLIEAEERHRKDAVTSVFKFLSNYDYTGFFRMKGRLYPIEEFETLTHQNSAGGSARYINNFIFIHESKVAQFHAAICQ
jgi:FkbM family methyltransferase